MTHAALGDWYDSGYHDAQNVIDVSQIRNELGEKPSAKKIKAWLLKDIASGAATDPVEELPKSQRKKAREAWADGWASYAEKAMASGASEAKEACGCAKEADEASLPAQTRSEVIAALARYGASLDEYDRISRGGKTFHVTIEARRGRLRMLSGTGNVLATYPISRVAPSISDFVEKFWYWKPDSAKGGAQEAGETREEAPRGDVDTIAADELRLFADNESAMYNQKQSIRKNLRRKMLKGTYDEALAAKLWLYWVDEAAKRYTKEFGGKWSEQFNKATREAVAADLAKDEGARLKSGEFDKDLGLGGREANEAAEASEAPRRKKKREEHVGPYHLVFLPANQAWGIFRGMQSDPSTWARVAGPAPYEDMKYEFNRFLSPYAGEAKENPVDVSDGSVPWVKISRDPEQYKAAMAIADKIGPVDGCKKIYELLGPTLIKEDQEVFCVVLLDVRQQVRGVVEVHRGSRSRVATSLVDVMRVVLQSGAEGFIVTHNHPTGKASPSQPDRELTKSIRKAAALFDDDVAFVDHVIIGNGQCYSFADKKLHRFRK